MIVYVLTQKENCPHDIVEVIAAYESVEDIKLYLRNTYGDNIISEEAEQIIVDVTGTKFKKQTNIIIFNIEAVNLIPKGFESVGDEE